MKQNISIQNKSKKKIDKFDTIYNAIFRIDDLKKKLVRSPIEINNNRYIQMWRDCFDRRGRFSRTQFNQYLPLFSEWDSAFYLMWLDLKSIEVKEDRTAIINCLVRLVQGSPFVDQYVDFILKDFFFYPLNLHYSDTNALIFANMLLFKNYAQRDYDFERTPEEALTFKEEKNTKLIDRLSNLIANEWGERFHEKVRTIKKNIYLALAPQRDQAPALPADILINMLREVLIFFTLVGGMSLYKVVHDTTEEFGNPDSELYHSKNSVAHLKSLFGLLQVAIRALVAFGDKKDYELLRAIGSKEKDFVALKGILDMDLAFHQKVVKKIMSVIEEGLVALQLPRSIAI
jgi:hypothetical protein